jgi:CheY-like chemotaxis protein
MYREALRLMPVDVVEASDGRDALVKCLVERPALLITETRLPAVDGYELCELLRRDALTQSVPILVVTSETRPVALARIRQVGASAVLSKPISIGGLVSEVTRLCDGSVAEESAGPIEHAALDQGGSAKSRSRTFRRFETTAPPKVPPAVRCTGCDRLLEYRKSRIGGVTQSNAEQWDEFRCPECAGGFEYRHRTRKLRLIT